MKDDVISQGKKAVELLSESEDAFDGPQATATLAEIYARVGEHDKGSLPARPFIEIRWRDDLATN